MRAASLQLGALRSPNGEATRLSANPDEGHPPDADDVALLSVSEPIPDSKPNKDYLTSAITLRIHPDKAQTDMLWAASRCMPYVQRSVTLGLLKDEHENLNLPPLTWAYRKAVQIAKEWSKIPVRPRKDGRIPDACWCWAGAFVGQAAKDACDRFLVWKKKNLEKASPPWAKSVGFSVRTDGVRLSRAEYQAQVSATLTMLGKKDNRRQIQPVFMVSVEGRQSHVVLDRILLGEYVSKACRVVNKDGKWLLKVSYQWPKPVHATAKGVMLVRRTTNKFLVAMTLAGESPTPPKSVYSIVAAKYQFDARKKAIRRDFVHRGTGARGHGKARLYREYSRLASKEADTATTWCQQQASWLVKEAVRLNCGLVTVEDFAESTAPVLDDLRLQTVLRRFPFAKLRDSIAWACAKHGIEFTTQIVRTSVECPVCGEVVQDRNCWKVCVCGVCVYPDTLAIWRMVRAAGLDESGMIERSQHEARLAKVIESRQKWAANGMV